MARIGLPEGSGKRLKVREKSVKSQGILKWILSGNPGFISVHLMVLRNIFFVNSICYLIIHVHRYWPLESPLVAYKTPKDLRIVLMKFNSPML